MTETVLGLDPSPLRLGWGITRINDGLGLRCGTIPLGIPADWLQSIPGREKRIERLKEMTHSYKIRLALSIVDQFTDEWPPALIYCESPYVGQNRKGAINIAMTTGEVVQAADARWGLPIEMVTSEEWKKAAGVEKVQDFQPERMDKEHISAAVRREAVNRGKGGHADDVEAASKPNVYLRALELGFMPEGSQDSADGGCISFAGYRINAGLFSKQEKYD